MDRIKFLVFLAIQLHLVDGQKMGDCSCGLERVKTRIIGGNNSQKDRYPWLAAISIMPGTGRNRISVIESECGGTLINDRYILTAAHCIYAVPYANLKIVFGDHTPDEMKTMTSVPIQRAFIHPRYNRYSRENDIALIKLLEPVDKEHKPPICLPLFQYPDNMFITGRGVMFNESLNRIVDSNVLMEASFETNLLKICSDRNGRILQNSQMCAEPSGKKQWHGVCSGDSGYPLSSRKEGHVYQIGIASAGEKDCSIASQKPNVFEMVNAYHLNWIKSMTSDGTYCKAVDQAIP